MSKLRNRITEMRAMCARELQDNQGNWRTHPKFQRGALAGVLGEVGKADVLKAYYSERQGGELTLVDGHLRKEDYPDEEWNVLILDVNDAEADILLLAGDPIAALAEAESDALDALLKTVETESEAVRALLEKLAADEGIDLGGEPVADPGAQVDKAAELQEKWQVETGDLWEIGAHRLICGDCTDGAVVEQVMGGEKAGFSFTDPPYNVGIRYGNETNDNKGRDEFVAWCKSWLLFLPRAFALTVGLKRLFWWADITGDPDWILSWVKMNGAAQSGIAGPNKWDPVLLYNVFHDKRSDVVEVNNSYSEGGEHPTAKPVKLWRIVIERFSQCDIVYDPFLGSGTTAVACEQLGRRCFGIEIEPKYCAVTLERLSQMGLEPRRVE